MKKVLAWLKNFFFPPAGTPLKYMLLPYILLGLLTTTLILAGTAAWGYTNSNEFCGTFCHTMPPQYETVLVSPHARVTCVDCHLGRADIGTQLVRKVEDGRITATAMITGNYSFPIRAHNMRPANESCETCHYPQKFSDDSMREIRNFANDKENTATSTYLILKTGGGTSREGLGYGIHWHIENPVVYLALDDERQEIPYMRVQEPDGSFTEYIDIETNFDLSLLTADNLESIDCITCHNRSSHYIAPPEEAVDDLLDRGVISTDIPYIRKHAIEVLQREYVSEEHAMNGIEALTAFYQQYYPDFYENQNEVVLQAVDAIKQLYSDSVYTVQKFDWNTHPDNIGHDASAGCFRCHDGKHVNAQGEAVRLECNICHSIPVVSQDNDVVANVEISRGPEPQSHFNQNWITLHREVFDETCQSCHTVEDPGGVSNTSFCSNSGCHGRAWEFAGFDAPGLRQILIEQIGDYQEPVQDMPPATGDLTYDDSIGAIFSFNCGSCHSSDNPLNGLDLSTYEGVINGGDNGPAITPGDVESSLVILKTTGEQPHFNQFNDEDLARVKQWIENGAPEN